MQYFTFQGQIKEDDSGVLYFICILILLREEEV